MIATAQLLRNHVIRRRQLGNKHTDACPTICAEREEGCRREINVPGHIKLMLVILIKGKNKMELNAREKAKTLIFFK